MILFVAIGQADRQARFDDAALLLGDELRAGSVYRLLAEHGDQLFGDEYFADLFARSRLGRPTVAARVVATVMLLQAHEGLSDREACDRLAYDLRWKAAAGIAVGSGSFHPTVLVGMRNRLRASERPRRLFEDVNTTARAAGLLTGRRRVLDSTPLLDAVATQDTVTQLRAAIRKLLTVAEQAGEVALAAAVRAVLARDDEYGTVGKPPCDWDDKAARDALVDALVRDANAALTVLHGRELTGPLSEAAELLALVAGQDVEADEHGTFRIARRVARDRVISTVDTQARHGHKSRARTFDGYKAHLAIDPDDELITNVAVTPANAADRDALDELLDETDMASGGEDDDSDQGGAEAPAPVTVFGDSAYADGATLDKLTGAGHEVFAKVPPVRNSKGYSKDQFTIDPAAGTVSCPAGHTAPIRARRAGGGLARFAQWCAGCPLRAACTTSRSGRVITIHPHEAALQQAKTAQRDPAWQQTYRTTRPSVERKIAHFTRRAWGGRRARCRGQARILTDVITRAGAVNLANLAVRGLHLTPTGWAIA
jgi:transposase